MVAKTSQSRKSNIESVRPKTLKVNTKSKQLHKIYMVSKSQPSDNFLYHKRIITDKSSVVRETGVQSKFESYQRLKNWYLTLPYLTLSIIRNGSRVK